VSLTLREWALQQLAAADKVAAEDLRAVPAVDVPANSSRALSLLSKLFGEQMQSLLGAGRPVKTLFDSDRMSLIIRLYGVRAKVRLRYTLEDTLATKLVLGQGSGDIEAEAIGLLLFDRIELNDFFLSAGKRGAIKNCFGAFGIQTLVVTGAIDRVENSSSPVNSASLARELCFGPDPETWDPAFGPRPEGLVASINAALAEIFWPISGLSSLSANSEAAAAAASGALADAADAFVQATHTEPAVDAVQDVVVQVAGGLWSGTHIDTVACAPGSPTFRSGLC